MNVEQLAVHLQEYINAGRGQAEVMLSVGGDGAIHDGSLQAVGVSGSDLLLTSEAWLVDPI